MKKLIPAMLMVIGYSLAFATDTYKVSFNYNDAGNRTSKTITMELTSAKAANSGNDQQKYAEKLGEATLSIYPNPTQGMLTIDLNDADFEQGNVYVLDLNGAELKREIMDTNKKLIDISSLPPAVYFLVIEIDGESTQWKIVKK